MAVIGPQNRGIPGYKPLPLPKPIVNTTGVGPQNTALPGYRPGDAYNPNGALAPGLSGAPAPLHAPAAPAPAAAPFDFSTLVGTDPEYIRESALNENQNKLAMGDPTTGDIGTLMRTFRQNAQGYQDAANAHGALFSGAATHANNYAAQQYADAAAQQAQTYNTNGSNILSAGWQRILNAAAGVS